MGVNGGCGYALGSMRHFGGGYLEVVTEVFHVLVLLYEVGGGSFAQDQY